MTVNKISYLLCAKPTASDKKKTYTVLRAHLIIYAVKKNALHRSQPSVSR